jgi:uncharacterized protein
MGTENLNNAIETDVFTEWLTHLEQSFSSDLGMNVDCGECRACCTSSYFIHIRADEINTLSKIPKELLFPAIGLPKGNFILGYNKKGHCPLFKDNNCSIYENRPLTCRKYDCRILTASGISEDKERELINNQAHRWKFKTVSQEDHNKMEAIKCAGKFLIDNEKEFPTDFIPKNGLQKAVMAIRIHDLFTEFLLNQKYLYKNKLKLIELIIHKFKTN